MAGAGKSDKKAAEAEVVRLRAPRKCPICGKDAVRAYYPFCSKRCADIDLNRWLSGGYAIPAVEGAEGKEPGDDEG
jgi:endogenous inhibitor of DNA gyrase (YacG/DUF329 family)